MIVEMEHTTAAARLEGGGSYKDLLRGSNRVRLIIPFRFYVSVLKLNNRTIAPLDYLLPTVALAGSNWSANHKYIFKLLLRHGWTLKSVQWNCSSQVSIMNTLLYIRWYWYWHGCLVWFKSSCCCWQPLLWSDSGVARCCYGFRPSVSPHYL
jgi:hypothetical protein